MELKGFDLTKKKRKEGGELEEIQQSEVIQEKPISWFSISEGRFIHVFGGITLREMGSFIGHILPGTLFLLVGLWHIWSCVVRYVSNPMSFRVRVWCPVLGFGGRLKYLELYLIVIGSFLDLCVELLIATRLKFFVHGVLNSVYMNNFEHSGMLIMFFIFGVISLLSEKTSFLPLPEGALCLIAATAFCAEYLLFYFHSTTHMGLEGYYHLILVLLISLCVLSTVAGALFPTSFPVDLCSGIAITLQGLWFYQTAFTLYGPMMPTGCRLKGDFILCHLMNHQVRGELLANFQLFANVFGVLVAVVASYGFAASRFGHPDLRRLHAAEDWFHACVGRLVLKLAGGDLKKSEIVMEVLSSSDKKHLVKDAFSSM
ncbi:unnamed protein product [Camellia sinensis]